MLGGSISRMGLGALVILLSLGLAVLFGLGVIVGAHREMEEWYP
mgnify:CR=1 FL=1|tara:strand:+ start:27003 stop:27134 length:132 start_codon:yes stop_codon:yes gene_type:complete